MRRRLANTPIGATKLSTNRVLFRSISIILRSSSLIAGDALGPTRLEVDRLRDNGDFLEGADGGVINLSLGLDLVLRLDRFAFSPTKSSFECTPGLRTYVYFAFRVLGCGGGVELICRLPFIDADIFFSISQLTSRRVLSNFFSNGDRTGEDAQVL